jgi:hypothetical protein
MDAHTGAVELFAKLGQVWARQDFAALRGLWKRDLAAPVYLAEEYDVVATSWTEWDDYFTQNRSSIQSIQSQYKVEKVVPRATGEALVVFSLNWAARMAPDGRKTGGFNRGVALIAPEGEGWAFTLYVESPLAAIVYLRKLYGHYGESLLKD